jgi:AcrR family transcriptional regulator
MTTRVKGPTTYRQQQAQLTKDRIAAAARRLFAEHGYSATSIDAIAAEAGVAVRTVYAAFGAKREILSAICERWLEEARARELADQALSITDTQERLRAAAHWLRNLYEHGFDVVTILDTAFDEDEETRKMLRAKLAGRNHVMERLTADMPHIQPVYRALAAPGVYRELVVETGWTGEQFETWVTSVLRNVGSRPGKAAPRTSTAKR